MIRVRLAGILTLFDGFQIKDGDERDELMICIKACRSFFTSVRLIEVELFDAGVVDPLSHALKKIQHKLRKVEQK